MKAKKTPHQKLGGTAKSEIRALVAARKALDGLSDDPEALRLFIAMIPLLGSVMLKNL